VLSAEARAEARAEAETTKAAKAAVKFAIILELQSACNELCIGPHHNLLVPVFGGACTDAASVMA